MKTPKTAQVKPGLLVSEIIPLQLPVRLQGGKAPSAKVNFSLWSNIRTASPTLRTRYCSSRMGEKATTQRTKQLHCPSVMAILRIIQFRLPSLRYITQKLRLGTRGTSLASLANIWHDTSSNSAYNPLRNRQANLEDVEVAD